jgi:filamentous hemagglutinin
VETAAGIAAEGDVAMQAGRDVNLLAQETTEGSSYKSGKKKEITESVRQQGTEILSGGGYHHHYWPGCHR